MNNPRESVPARGRHLLGLRRAAGNALFTAGVISIVAGSWLFLDAHLLALGLLGGVVMFALADLIAPFRGDR